MLQNLGLKLTELESESQAVKWLEHGTADLVLSGLDEAGGEAFEFVLYMRRKHPRTPVVLMSREMTQDRVREARLRGAAGTLKLPVAANQLRAAVWQALGEPEPEQAANGVHGRVHGVISDRDLDRNGEAGGKRVEIFSRMAAAHGGERAGVDSACGFIGDDSGIKQAVETALMIAGSRTPVLIVGERGTGKTMLARMLHEHSPRRSSPFVELQCGGRTDGELEVELFGREGVAGGEPSRMGRVSMAEGGTLFLEDVGSLSPAMQFRLMRLLRDGEYEAAGSSAVRKADVRLIVHAAEDLAPLAQDGRFRQDLYYRIGVVTLKLPPLRMRGGDLERLAEHFRASYAREIEKSVTGISPEAMERLHQHEWPGNVQELKHVIERAVVTCRGNRIEATHLVFAPREGNGTLTAHRAAGRASRPHVAMALLPLKEALEGPEKQIILEALEALNWNRQETARVLDINRTTLYKKMKKYGLIFDEPAWMN